MRTSWVHIVYAGHDDNTETAIAAYSRRDHADRHIDRLFTCAVGERSNAALLGIRSARIARIPINEN